MLTDCFPSGVCCLVGFVCVCVSLSVSLSLFLCRSLSLSLSVSHLSPLSSALMKNISALESSTEVEECHEPESLDDGSIASHVRTHAHNDPRERSVNVTWAYLIFEKKMFYNYYKNGCGQLTY